MQPRLEDPVSALPGVGPAIEKKLKSLGVTTIRELLYYLPSRLEDQSNVQPIGQLRYSEPAVIKAEIRSVTSRRSKRGILLIQAKLQDETGLITALWFNQRYLLGTLHPGERRLFYGEKRLSPSLGNPFFVKKIITEPGIVPVYPTVAGLAQYSWRKMFQNAKMAIGELIEPFPPSILETEKLPGLAESLAAAHFPTSLTGLGAAENRLGFEELIGLAMAVNEQNVLRRRQKCPPIPIDKSLLAAVAANFSFQLTPGQRRVAWTIIQDLATGRPMRRLLYGEVGSGKTAVAALVAAAVLSAKKQVIILAPTTTLAAQHLNRFKQYLEPAGFSVDLLTSETRGDEHADCLIATHAAFHGNRRWSKLGLVIVDEQHRFGVEQRLKLLTDRPSCHVLMMTATPIPRSLAQTIFRSLDVSYLTDKPIHQLPITTKVFSDGGRPTVEKEIQRRLDRDEPGYVICPLIEPSAETPTDMFALERKTVKGEVERLKKRFPRSAIGLLHGRLKETEKQRVIADFRTGKTLILVATTVVEVGIDHPAASWLLVEEADRFGLSQLHQLRGRVGRGERASVCFLSDSGVSALGHERLKVLQKTTDGLELAEEDLRLRGPGELTGLDQSGLPPLKYVDWRDRERISRIFEQAEKLAVRGLVKTPLLYKAKNDDENKDADAII